MCSIFSCAASSTRWRRSSVSNHASVRRMPSRKGMIALKPGTKLLILLLSRTYYEKRDGTMIHPVEDRVAEGEVLTDRAELRREVELAVRMPVIDVHTHVFPPEFDGLF